MKDDVQSLSHSKWRCKYHIVFAPKYRRMVIYRKIKADIGKYEGAIQKYLHSQLQEDMASGQISLKEFTDPFTGQPVKQGK